ncbi:MAG TPA: rhodanese-related sulfurtransferase [Pseudomonadales bacterium]
MPAVMTGYRFVPLADLAALRDALERDAAAAGLRGTILLAEEGINMTLAGPGEALAGFHLALTAWPPFAGLEVRFSEAGDDIPVFRRLKVRIRPEIVRFGQPGVAPHRRTGERVDPARWHALLDDPGVVVLDTRNDYEVAIGTFPGAVNPGTRAFRQFPAFVQRRLDPARHRRVAMFCTGGIRCEKASAWLLEQGFEAVYQLDGGILGYLDQVTPDESRWRGECFVFDQRVAVDQRLRTGSHRQCFACRRALSAADLESPHYREGVSCPYCIDEHDERRRAGFLERRRQVELAAARGLTHLGPQ